jgi:polysaccharide export outer membrane protein
MSFWSREMTRLVLFLTAVLALAGCASPNKPLAPAQAAVADYKYLIGPGDSVNIIVWRNPELSMSVPVRPDGKLTSPLIEDLVAFGKNPTDLAREIEKKLTKFIQDPVVTVIVTNFVGPFSEQIRIVGSATRPSALPYRQNMTVLDAMIAVGGITEFASGNRAVLIRTADSGKQYTLRLRDLLRHGDVSANADLRPGDVIIIPEGFF